MAKAQTTEIISVDAEEVIDAPVSEMVQKAIDGEVKRFDPFEARLNELKEQYKDLTIIDVDDKEGYEAVRLAIAELRKISTDTAKDKKAIKAPFLKACTSIEEKSKWIIEEVSKLRDPLQARKDQIDAEKEKIKIEKKKKQDEAFILRQAELTRFGAVYRDGSFVLGDVSYESILLREADEEIYATMREQYKAIFDKQEASRLEAERLQAEAAQKLADERAEFERLKAEQQAEAERLKAEADRLQRLKEEAEAAEKAEAERKEQERREIELSRFQSRLSQLKGYNYDGVNVSFEGTILGTMEEVIRIPTEIFDAIVEAHNKLLTEREEDRKAFEAANAAREAKQSKRIAELYELGLKFDAASLNDRGGGYFVNYDVFIHSLDITGYDDANWEELIFKTAAHIKAYKEREEEKKNAEAQAKQDAAIAEALAIAQREAAEKQEKELAEKQRLEAEETEKRNQSSDKAKWQHAKDYFMAYPWPEFASGQYKKKMNDTKTYHQSL